MRDSVRSPLVGLDQPERRARVRRGVHRRTRVRVADHGSGHGRDRGDRAFRSRAEGSHEQAGLDPTAADRGDRHCPGRNRRRRAHRFVVRSRPRGGGGQRARRSAARRRCALVGRTAGTCARAPSHHARDCDAPSHLADGRRDHGLIRQDHDEAVRASPHQWKPTRRRDSGELQQRRGALARDHRAARSGNRGVHRRDGHVREGRDLVVVRVGQAPDRRRDRDRTGAPRADALARHDRRGEVRDPRVRRDCSVERRRLRPRRRCRRQPPRGQARHRMQRGEAHEPRRRPRPAGRRPFDDRRRASRAPRA